MSKRLQRPNRPCSRPGCPNLTTGRYCEKHQVIKLSDLKRVKGIGEKTIQRIKETLLTEKDNRNDLPVIRKDIQEFKDKFICGDNVEVLRQFPNDCIDLTITSPPYDNLRTYNGFEWVFEDIAKELYRVTKHGGVVVWVVGNETKNFCESLSSFKQALFFVEICGFNLLDTMIYKKKSYAPAYPTLRRYASVFEYMFVFSKSRPKTFNELRESKEETSIRGNVISSFRQRDGSLKRKNTDRSKKDKAKTNVWEYLTGSNAGEDKLKFEHPATFPDLLANDHIISWSNPGDIVLDPFGGSGTTAKMSILNDRHFIYIDCSQEYCDLSKERVANTTQDVVNGKRKGLQ